MTAETEYASATYLHALCAMKDVANSRVLKLLKVFPTPHDFECAPNTQLIDLLGRKAAESVRVQRDEWGTLWQTAKSAIDRHLDAGITPLATTDILYPTLLSHPEDRPAILFVKGSVEALQTTKAVAVVGTRNPTPRGLMVAQRVARHFASQGYCIVSGLAKGLDTAGHRGALEIEGVCTVAVMGTPLDSIYPKENTRLAEEICDRGGALVSEYPLDTPVVRSAFAQRDRIQAGMSLAVIVVQTDIDGGSMHAVRAAAKYGRLVLCPDPFTDREDSAAPQYAGIKHILAHSDSYGHARSFRADNYAEIEERLEALRLKLAPESENLQPAPAPTTITDSMPKDAPIPLTLWSQVEDSE